MDFQLSEEHRLIQQTARRVSKEIIAPRAAEMDVTGEYPHDVFKAFKDTGLTGLTIPTQYGGSGAGMLALALAVEEAAKYCCASGLMLLLSALPSQPVMIGGDERQKQWIGKGIASGEIKGAFCLTEPNHGSDAGNLETTAKKDGDDYILNGEKMYISGGTVADYIIAFARTNGTPGPKGIAAFIVETKSPGFKVAGQDRKMGVRGVPTADIVLEDVRVPRENLVGGAENQGFNQAMMTLNSCRPVVGARGVGLAEGAMTYALDFARQREAFGKPIAELQAIQFMFAEMAIAIEAARLLVYQGAWRVDQGLYSREHAAYLSIAKAFATETAVKVSSDALQVLGAQGYMMDHPLERHYRDARQLMIVEGTSQVQRVVIARALLERELVYP
jgi:alkylation response protein AidB-like acyl-CoA dehydrogenase